MFRHVCSTAVLALLLVACVIPAYANNFWERHGHDFTYVDDSDTEVVFPVIWDNRTAFFQLRDYYVSYGGDVDDAYDAIDSLYKHAFSHGVNFANVRGEIARMSLSQLETPDTSHHFVKVADIIMDRSLSIFAGGFLSSISSSAIQHNDSVVTYLAEYRDSLGSWSGGRDGFIGIHGFDEPEAAFEGPGWNQCQENWQWHHLAQGFSEAIRDEMNSSSETYPFSTFYTRWRTIEDDTLLHYQTTIPLFCEEYDVPLFDYYPCCYGYIHDRTFADEIEYDEVFGATDLIPSGSVSYEAYTGQDEIFAMDDSGWFRVFEFINETSHTTNLSVQRADSHQVASLSSDPVWGASDFRAMDIGNRTTDQHRLNGAVVICDGDDPSDNLVVLHDGSDLVFLDDDLDFPRNLTATTAVCVGEFNYPEHYRSNSTRAGLIGHGELRVLVCYQREVDETVVDEAKIFEWSYSADSMICVGTITERDLEFTPAGAVWGVFWPEDNHWDIYNGKERSGFIIYDVSGNYQSIYEDYVGGFDPPYVWAISEEHTNSIIFPLDENSFIARSSGWFPCFTAGADYICRLTEGTARGKLALLCAWGGGSTEDSALDTFTSEDIDPPNGYDFGDVTGASCARFFRNVFNEVLLVSFEENDSTYIVYKGSSELDFHAEADMSISFASSPTWTVTAEYPFLTSSRVYDVRLPYRIPILAFPIIPYYPHQMLLARCDISAPDWRDTNLVVFHVAIDTMFTYGIEDTDIDNCLIHNLRCAGRHEEQQITWYAPEDTLLYMASSSIVHGSRGIHLRAMNFSMMAGNGGPPYPAYYYFTPPLLLNWGPSVEIENVDMVGRMQNVVQMLTGKNTSNPDFLSALVDDDYTALDTTYAQNAMYTGSQWIQDDDPYLNFLALMDTLPSDSLEILLMVVNDEDEFAVGIIRFPEYYEDNCTLQHIAGFELVYSLRSETKLAMDFGLMPEFTASLYRITYLPPD